MTTFSRAAVALGRPAAIALAAALGSGALGCSMLTAVTNPSAAFAIQEPAHLGVVVRRAEVARATATEIDRLMASSPVDDDSEWLARVAIKKDDASGLLKAASAEPVYAGSQVRIVPAEAWVHGLAGICSDAKAYPNAIAASGPDVAKLYGEIAVTRKTLADLRASLATEEKALDAEKISASDKAAHEKSRDGIKARIEKLQDAIDKKQDALIEALKAPSKAPVPLRDKLRVAVANLKTAVKDAQNANSAALLGYPLALRGVADDVQKAAPRIVADVIEDKTGVRPDLNGFKPDVKLDGMDVKLTLNGVPADKLGSLDMAELVSETTSRLKAYAKIALTLPVYAAETADTLSFEAKLLDAYLEGLGGDKGAAVDWSGLTVQAAAQSGSHAADAKTGDAPKRHRYPGGLLLASACKVPSSDDTAPKMAAAAAPPADAVEPAPASAPAESGAPPSDAPPPKPAASSAPDDIAPPPAKSHGSPVKTIGVVSLVGGGLGLAGGGVLGVLAAKKHSDLTAGCTNLQCPPALHTEVDQYRTLANASTVSLIAGGGLAAIGVALIVAAPSPTPSKDSGKIVPFIGPGSAGAMGRF